MESIQKKPYEYYPNRKFPQQAVPTHLLEMSPLAKEILLPIFMRRYRETNFFLTTSGYPGTGKSFALLKMFEELQVEKKDFAKNFDVDEQVVFTGMDFIRQVRKTDPDKQPGKCILFDEIEIEANSKGWDKVGQQIALAVNTMRFKMNILGASLPRETDLLKGVRSLRNARLLTKDIDFSTNHIVAKYQYLDYNLGADTNLKYNRDPAKSLYPRVSTKSRDGKLFSLKINEIRVGKPSKLLIKKYKKKKVDYLNGFYDRQLDFFKKEERKRAGGLGFSEVYAYIKRNEKRLGVRGKIEPILLADQLQISKTQARDFAKAYEAKQEIKELNQIYDD